MEMHLNIQESQGEARFCAHAVSVDYIPAPRFPMHQNPRGHKTCLSYQIKI